MQYVADCSNVGRSKRCIIKRPDLTIVVFCTAVVQCYVQTQCKVMMYTTCFICVVCNHFSQPLKMYDITTLMTI